MMPLSRESVLLLAAAGGSLVAAAAWFYVGARLARRSLPPQHRDAGRALVTAVFGGGAFSTLSALAGAAVVLLGGLGAAGLPIAWTMLLLGTLIAAGLVGYLAHLLTGSRHAVRIVAAFWIAELLGIVAFVLSLEPTGAVATGWTVRFEFAQASDRANPLLAGVVLAPAAIASIAYLSLLRGAREPTARWRIALVGGGFTLWLAAAIATRLVDTPSQSLAAARLSSIAASLAIYLAYVPPRWAARRWGIHGLPSEVARPPPTRLGNEALAQRVRELV